MARWRLGGPALAAALALVLAAGQAAACACSSAGATAPLCHFRPAFTNGDFADAGVPHFVEPGRVDPGRHGGIRKLRRSPYTLLGRFNDDAQRSTAAKTRYVRLRQSNFGEFRVPGLRNVALTAPYMHAGSLETLADVARHYSTLDEERLQCPSPWSPLYPGAFPHALTRQGPVRGRNDHRRSERVAIAAARTFVRIRESLRNRAASDISHSRRSPCFCSYSGSRRLPPPAAGCQCPAMVRLRAPGLEYGRFRSAYDGLRYLAGRTVAVGTRVCQDWRIQRGVRGLVRQNPRTGPTSDSEHGHRPPSYPPRPSVTMLYVYRDADRLTPRSVISTWRREVPLSRGHPVR